MICTALMIFYRFHAELHVLVHIKIYMNTVVNTRCKQQHVYGCGQMCVYRTKSVLVFRYRVIHMYSILSFLSLSTLFLSLTLAVCIQEYNKKLYFSHKRQERKWKKNVKNKKKLHVKTSDNSSIECQDTYTHTCSQPHALTIHVYIYVHVCTVITICRYENSFVQIFCVCVCVSCE